MDKFDKYLGFVRGIKLSDKVVLCFDQDGDGISATVLMLKAFQRLKINNVHWVPFIRNDRMHVAEEILAWNPTHVIFLDVSAEIYDELMGKLVSKKVMVIDHHETHKSFDGVTVLKPQNVGFEESNQYCTAKLVYDYMSNLVDLEDVSWITAVGIISDMGQRTWTEFLRDVFEKHKFEMKDDWYETVPGKIAQIVNSATSVNPIRSDEAIALLLNSLPREILKSPLSDLNAEINAEIAKWMKEPIESFHEGLLNIQVMDHPSYSIGGVVSNKRSTAEREKAFIVISVFGDKLKVSARSQDFKVPMNDLLKKSIKDFDKSNAGGHDPASGASLPSKHLEEFKKNLVKVFGEILQLNSAS
jgi:single-stranded DNA-specific DHH superfamily exonuclease